MKEIGRKIQNLEKEHIIFNLEINSLEDFLKEKN